MSMLPSSGLHFIRIPPGPRYPPLACVWLPIGVHPSESDGSTSNHPVAPVAFSFATMIPTMFS